MPLCTDLQLSLAAPVKSRWVDLRNQADVSLQLDCQDVASPVGVITVEGSNDVKQCDFEIQTDVAPASSTAQKQDITASLDVDGAALATGYDGVGAKVSFCRFPIGLPMFARVVFTRTSGGNGDTLHVRFNGR